MFFEQYKGKAYIHLQKLIFIILFFWKSVEVETNIYQKMNNY